MVEAVRAMDEVVTSGVDVVATPQKQDERKKMAMIFGAGETAVDDLGSDGKGHPELPEQQARLLEGLQ